MVNISFLGHPSVVANHSPSDLNRLQDNIENLRSHIGREVHYNYINLIYVLNFEKC